MYFVHNIKNLKKSNIACYFDIQNVLVITMKIDKGLYIHDLIFLTEIKIKCHIFYSKHGLVLIVSVDQEVN